VPSHPPPTNWFDNPLSPTPTKKQLDTAPLPYILTTNTRSLKNKTGTLNDYLRDAYPDLVFLSETWIKANPAHADTILRRLHQNYLIFSTPRTKHNDEGDIKRGGGTLILVNKDYATKIQQIKPEPYKRPAWMEASDERAQPNVELTIVKFRPARLPRGYSTCIAICVYIPEWTPNRQAAAILQLRQAIEGPITSCITNNKPLIIISGDFNGADVTSICSDHGLYLVNKQPTRKNRLLDLILTNAPRSYTCQNHPPVKTSDHAVIIAGPDPEIYKRSRPKAVTIMKRQGKVRDTVNQLRNEKWPGILKPSDGFIHWDLQTASDNIFAEGQGQPLFDSFYNTLHNAMELHQPLVATKISNDPPWMTSEIKNAIIARKKLFNKKNKSEVDLIKEKEAYRVTRFMIKQGKRAYYSRFQIKHWGYWDVVRENQGRKLTLQIDQQLATTLNNNFYAVWNGVEQPNLDRYIIESPNAPKLFTVDNVTMQLKQLKPTSTGPDGIPAKLLKAARFELAEPITALFNACIQNNFVPSQWKEANITPIGKCANPTEKDYRPISLISVLGKTFERIMAKFIFQITKAMWRTNNQYGFLPAKNTMDAIAQVIEDWSEGHDKNMTILAIFFDFAKAFDLVNHEKLLEKLQRYLPQWIVSWLAVYLTERRQRVSTSQSTTDWKRVEAGVIQGSVLGPILFILFIYDINEYMPPGVDIRKYADDILNYIITNDIELLAKLPQQIADGVSRWCSVNDMRLNIGKCKIMLITRQPSAAAPVTLDGEPLEVVSSYKYLGIEMNNKNEWDMQWSRVKSQTSGAAYLLSRLRYLGFKEEILVSVFRSHVLSHFIYSAPLLISPREKIQREMTSFINRLLRIIRVHPEKALAKYQIDDITTFIEKTCENILQRILNFSDHPISCKIKKWSGRSSRPQTNRFNRVAYKNSFIQKSIRILRDGHADLYTTGANRPGTKGGDIRSQRRSIGSPMIARSERKQLASATCPICFQTCKSNAGLASHTRLRHKKQ
jgi:hypothetical protein